ncbi:DUF2141 domain-containing protein [Asaia sp. BMEF1]|uniref:DUF2141 domain-containing protein n=1 Tax=Asaia sp. BMEF1 TaxID=3155932 RepID=UPI003F664CD3
MRHEPGFSRRLLTGVILTILVAPLPALAGPVTAIIENIPDDSGTIRVAICTEDEFLKPSCRYHAETKAVAPKVSVSFEDVPEGVYAVQAFQDRNGNAKLDRSFIGIPREPIGFSRDPKVSYGPPGFDDCAVKLTPAGGALALKLITH